MTYLAEKIRILAERYEERDFLMADPSQFMHRYKEQHDIEIVALFAATLAFGRRASILEHIEKLLGWIGTESPAEWILNEKYREYFPDSTKSFYRVFTYRNLLNMCNTLRDTLANYGSLGLRLKADYEINHCAGHPGRLATVLASYFPQECSPIIAKDEKSANKRLNLYLRWMVRRNSPVDLGLWYWYPQSELIIPMDTHVVAVAKKYGFLPPNATATLANAIALTNAMKEIFPDDPTRGDFALFGSGVDE